MGSKIVNASTISALLQRPLTTREKYRAGSLCYFAPGLVTVGTRTCLQSAFAPWPHLSGEQCSIGFQPVSAFTADGPQDRQRVNDFRAASKLQRPLTTRAKYGLEAWLLFAVARSQCARGACLQSAFAPWPHLSGEQCSIGFQPVSAFTADGLQDHQRVNDFRAASKLQRPLTTRARNIGWKPVLLFAVAAKRRYAICGYLFLL